MGSGNRAAAASKHGSAERKPSGEESTSLSAIAASGTRLCSLPGDFEPESDGSGEWARHDKSKRIRPQILLDRQAKA